MQLNQWAIEAPKYREFYQQIEDVKFECRGISWSIFCASSFTGLLSWLSFFLEADMDWLHLVV